MENLGLTLAFIVLVVILLYKYLTRNYDYWAKQNIPFIKPKLIVGSTDLSKPLHQIERHQYEKYGRIYGRFDGTIPVLTIADPDLLKLVLVQDFDVFPNHRYLKCNDPIMDNSLFILNNSDWKRTRTIVSPIFTGAKLKKMLPLLDECCNEIIQKCDEAAKKDEAILCQNMFKKFVINCVARCTFGIRITAEEVEALAEKADKVFLEKLSLRTMIILFFPSLMKLFRISLLNPDSISFFTKFVLEVINTVKSSSTEGKSDFLQRIIRAESTNSSSNTGNNVDKSQKQKTPLDHPSAALSRDEAIAQCVNFFMAGLDPTTTLIYSSLYHLAINDKYQERALKEIKNVIEENENNLSYEALAEMKFLDAVIFESLRLCPSLVRNDRRVERDYTLGGIQLKKGMLVSIPYYAMHRDPEFFPDPDKFLPERFLEDDLKPPPYVHLPFGAGPRICLGKRFVEVAVKQCLAKLLLKYNVVLPDKSLESPPIKELRGTLSFEETELKFVIRSD